MRTNNANYSSNSLPFVVIHGYLFGAGGTIGGSAAAARGTRRTFKLPSNRKGEGGHDSLDFFALTFGAGNLFRRVQY